MNCQLKVSHNSREESWMEDVWINLAAKRETDNINEATCKLFPMTIAASGGNTLNSSLRLPAAKSNVEYKSNSSTYIELTRVFFL